jgi:hypothetical protein
MKKLYRLQGIVVILLASLLISSTVSAQENDSIAEAPKKERPARPAFESGLIFDNATTTIQPSNTLEMVIQHRFGTIDNGISDVYGIMAPSAVRIGLNYSILNNLLVGIGTSNIHKTQDIQIKYNILQQTRSNSIPLTISLYEVIGIDAMAESKWGPDYKFANRLSYFSQVILSRRFNDNFSFQIAPSFTHYNAHIVDTLDHDRIAISFAGRYKFSPQSSIIIGGDFPLKIQSISEQTEDVNSGIENIKPNISIGLEVSTSTHAFHIYLGSSRSIIPQENIMFNENDFFDGTIFLGMNITRLWGF